MQSKAYTKGFLDAISSFEKLAEPTEGQKAVSNYFKRDYKRSGVTEPEEYRKPTTFAETTRYNLGRAGDYLGSLGRGLASAVGVTGARAAQSALSMVGFIPRTIDQLVFGKMMGVGGGQGLTGRMFGKIDRGFDRVVHGMRDWSNRYDEKHRIGGGFNRFMNGVVADSVGGFAGFGGIAGLVKKQKLPVALAGAFGGAMPIFSGSQKELRDREAWMRSLDPRDRIRMDATSTATNQENAPTLEEYRRYHMPASGLPTSVSGRVRIPYNWSHQRNGLPVQFRDYGT